MIDEYFDTWIDFDRKMVYRIRRGKYGIYNLPPLSLLLDLVDELPDIDRDDYVNGKAYEESVSFMNQLLSKGGGKTVRLVRSFRMDDLEDLSMIIEKGDAVGIYWSTMVLQSGLSDFDEHGCPVKADNFVVISARFGVDCIDVLKTMLANLIWGVKREAEVRMIAGCTGDAIHAAIYDHSWNPIDEMSLEGRKVVT